MSDLKEYLERSRAVKAIASLNSAIRDALVHDRERMRRMFYAVLLEYACGSTEKVDIPWIDRRVKEQIAKMSTKRGED